MATLAEINSIYQDNFGRPADEAGANWWLKNANPNVDLSTQIKSGAQTQDSAAMQDIAKDKLNPGTTWGSGLSTNDVASQTVTYDADANRWVAPKPAPNTAPVAYENTASLNRSVDAPKETIEGRINGLLSANNPVIQQAGSRAMQQFQQRGLLNSSMAIQAANEAMTAKAIEIAGPDAATYTKTALQNQTEANQFSRNEQQLGYDMRKQAADQAARGSLQAQQDAAALARQNAGNADTAATNATKAAESSSRLYADGVNTIEREYLAAVDQINNQDIDPATKTQRIAERRTLTNQSINAWNAASRSLQGWTEQWAVLPVAA